MRYYYVFFLSTILFIHATAQSYSCDEFDPNEFEHTTEIWDWRIEEPSNWEAYVTTEAGGPMTSILRSPFADYGTYEPNVSFLYNDIPSNKIDYQPSDGWELLYKNFGKASLEIAVDNPTFALYNRFSGQLRVFLYARKSIGEIVSAANLQLNFDRSGKVSSLLAFLEQNSYALDSDPDKKVIDSDHPNEYNNPIDGVWLFAQIPTFYDPCVCAYNNEEQQEIPKLVIEGSYHQTSNVEIEGLTQSDPPSSENVVTNSSLNTNLHESVGLMLNTISGAVKAGNATYKTLDGLNSSLTFQKDNSKSNADEGSEDTTGLALSSIFSEFPIIGKYVSFVSFFVSSAQKINKGDKASSNSSFEKTEYNGNISTTGQISGHSFYHPGTENSNLPGDLNKPIYNYNLGIISLAKTPVIEYVTYKTDDEIEYINQFNQSLTEEFYDPNIQQYHLKEPIEIVVNPASELELIDVKASLLYDIPVENYTVYLPQVKYHPNVDAYNPSYYPIAYWGPIVSNMYDNYDNMTYEERLGQDGVIIENRPKLSSGSFTNKIEDILYSTGLRNLDCLQDESVFLASSTISQSINTPTVKPRFRVRLVLTLRRTDENATANSDDIRMITTFNAKVEDNVKKIEHPETGEMVSVIGTYSITKEYDIEELDNNWPMYMKHYAPTNFSTPYSSGPFFQVKLKGTPLNIDYDNTTITTQKYDEALNSITFSNVNTAPGYSGSNFKAENYINLKKETTLSAEASFEINTLNQFSECSEISTTPMEFSDIEDINTWCSGNYDNNLPVQKSSSKRTLSQDYRPNFNVYPNPANNFFTFELDSQLEQVTMNLFAATGNLIMQKRDIKNKETIDISSLVPGVYIIEIYSKTYSSSQKLIISH